jgi:thiol-disulfide isomerase/thioredoxin
MARLREVPPLQSADVSLCGELHNPARGKKIGEYLGSENARRIRGLNPEDLRREAEALYERTIKEFGNVRPINGSPSLGKLAEGALFEVRNLEIGCTIPEIEDEDLDGKPMRLSDFRGKVVVLSFWAGWCGPCMSMVASEKSLVERMRGRPFVLIGVNGDLSRATAKSVCDQQGINWRSFWDGGRRAGIALKWGIHLWPTIFLVDGTGVIRGRFEGDDFEPATEALVADAEATRKP